MKRVPPKNPTYYNEYYKYSASYDMIMLQTEKKDRKENGNVL